MITRRTCANCAAFNAAPAGDEPTCWNLVSITDRRGATPDLHRAPGPFDHCHEHSTHAENEAEKHLIEKARQLGGDGYARAAALACAVAHATILQASSL